MADEAVEADMLELTAQIVSAHLSGGKTDHGSLPALIGSVFRTLQELGGDPAEPAPEKPQPAVPVRRSVFADHIVCLEDGKKLKMLKRHLKTAYAMTPESYRERWGLPPDYPMVAPNYASHRSELAKKIGLGRKPGGPA